jgi:hypothetical protein
VRVHVSEAGNRHCFSEFARGFAGQRFAGIRRHFDRDRRFDHDRRFRRGFFSGQAWISASTITRAATVIPITRPTAAIRPRTTSHSDHA